MSYTANSFPSDAALYALQPMQAIALNRILIDPEGCYLRTLVLRGVHLAASIKTSIMLNLDL